MMAALALLQPHAGLDPNKRSSFSSRSLKRLVFVRGLDREVVRGVQEGVVLQTLVVLARGVLANWTRRFGTVPGVRRCVLPDITVRLPMLDLSNWQIFTNLNFFVDVADMFRFTEKFSQVVSEIWFFKQYKYVQ